MTGPDDTTGPDHASAGAVTLHGPPATYHQGEFFTDPRTVPVFASVVPVDEVVVHGHDFLEIAVVVAGTGVHVTSSGRAPIAAGDVFVLRPGAWHGFVDGADLVIANCCLTASSLSRDIAFLRDIPALRGLLWTGPSTLGRHGVLSTRFAPVYADTVRTEVGSLADQLTTAPRNRAAMLGRLLTVLGRLAGLLDDVEDRGDSDPRGTMAPPLPGAVATTIDLLEGDPAAPWRIEDLAARVALDPAYLTRLFRLHLGQPPIAYLARIRAEHAATLLARSELPIARVGAQVGWPDPTYFARRFRALRGITPSAYRRRLRAPDHL